MDAFSAVLFLCMTRARFRDVPPSAGSADLLVLAARDGTVVGEWCMRAIRLGTGHIVADGPAAQVLGPG